MTGAEGAKLADVLATEIVLWSRKAQARSIVVGLCGPQGAGKSTLTAALALALRKRNLHAATLSLDDFYVSRAARARLAKEVHPLLATRGPPGTHDVELAFRTLSALTGVQSSAVQIPRFDKAMDEPWPEQRWPVFCAPASVVLLEGWCVRARPQHPSTLGAPVNELERVEDATGAWRAFVNASLGDAYQRLFGIVDRLILLQPPTFDIVLPWRLQQEAALRARSGSQEGVMDERAVARFIMHFERLTRHIMREGPDRADVVVYLNRRRETVALTRNHTEV